MTKLVTFVRFYIIGKTNLNMITAYKERYLHLVVSLSVSFCRYSFLSDANGMADPDSIFPK